MGADVTAGARHTGDELVALAAASGLTATKRLIRRWVQLGLLDHPSRVGLGRGRGIRATWSGHQAQMLLRLLKAQQSGASVAAPCRLPVWLWLRWGDEFVPLRQVRQALATWQSFVENPTWSGSEAASRAVVAALAAPGARRAVRTRLRGVVARQAFGDFDADELRTAAKDAMHEGAVRDASRARLAAADDYTDLVTARKAALDQLQQITEEEFTEARDVYRLAVVRYKADQPKLAKDPEIGSFYSPRTVEEEVNAACIDLITLVGLSRARAVSDARPNE